MSPMRVICRVVPAGAVGAAALLFVTGARGEPVAPKRDGEEEAGACLAAFKSAEAHEQAGHLVEAGRLFGACGAAWCGSPLWQECAARNTRVRSYTPSVVPFAVDASGAPRADVEVKMDGLVLASRLDGRALLVDPGTHEFAFSTKGGVFATKRVTVVRGQRNLPISASLPSAQ